MGGPRGHREADCGCAFGHAPPDASGGKAPVGTSRAYFPAKATKRERRNDMLEVMLARDSETYMKRPTGLCRTSSDT